MTSPHFDNVNAFATESPDLPVTNQRRAVARSENLRFFLKWLASPLGIGAPLASGKSLASAIARGVDPSQPGFVVELGGGSGAITQTLLNCGVPRDRLVVIERDRQFFELLVARYPGVRTVCGNATDLMQILRDIGVDKVNALVSGLPLLSMPLHVRKRILRQSFDTIADSGVLLQFSYGLGSPVPVPLLEAYGMAGKPVARVWRNLPPAKVWCYRRQKHGPAGEDPDGFE